MYRGFVKNINNLAGKAISSSDMRITSIDIKRDILTKATSDFKVVEVPNAINEGDVFGVYDDFGKIVYLGVIKSVDDNNIQCDQIISIFDDKWKWRNPNENTIERKIKAIIDNDYANSSDALEKEIFNDFNISTISSTYNDLQSEENNYVVNFMQFLFDIYESYGIMVDIDVSFNAVAPTIKIGKPSYPVIKLGNNNQVLRNFEIIRETQETNKLVVYEKDGKTLRGTYYATPSGITINSESLDRLTDINTQIVCSDDEIEDIIASNLSEQMYNHKITCQLVLENKLYDFNKFNLGQQFDIYNDGVLYNSILTGYKIRIDNAGKASVVDLVFGKVRYSLENIIYKMKRDISSSNTTTEDVIDLPVADSSTLGGVKSGGDISVNNSGKVSVLSVDGKQILSNSTEVWSQQPTFVASAGSIIIYSDYKTLDNGEVVAGVKIGDGDAYLVDLPFVTDAIAEQLIDHINNTTVHITAEERASWNNKVTVSAIGTNLKFDY